MKKLITLLMTLILSVTFISCGDNNQLEKPENLVFSDALTWDEVEGADEYLVIINGEEMVLEVPYLSLVEEGTYEIQIIARATDLIDSDPAEISFEIDYDQDAEITLTKTGDVLSFNSVEKATHYMLVIGEAITRIETTNYTLSGEYNYPIYVYAVFPDGSKTVNSNQINA